ncbi:putative membrane protein [Desulfovibrio sp. A2]|nr:putative membrane protein [Desulfovibrio sp. A2]
MLTAATVSIFLLLVVACRLSALHHYRWWFRQGFVGDASVHFSIIRQLRKNRRSQYIEQYLMSPEPMVYPTYFHHFARFFPLDAIKAHPYLPSLVLSLLFSCVFIILAAHINESLFTGSHGLLQVSAMLILCSPTFHCFGGNSITYIALSERTLARLATGLSYMLCCVFLLTGDIISLACGISFGALACLSSIFARQVLLFTMPVLAGLLMNWRPLAMLLAIFIMALAAGGKHFARGLQHTFLHWMCYTRFTKKGRITRIGLSEFKPWSFRDNRITWKTITENLLTKEPTRTFLNNIELPAAICLLAMSDGNATVEWAAFLAAPIIVYIATSTAWLSFLGEGYRYIEYALVYLAPLAAAVQVATAPPPALAALAAVMTCSLIGIGVIWHTKQHIEHRPPPETVSDRLSTFLSGVNLPDDAVVFPVTMRLGADITARKEGWKSFWWQPGLQLPSIFDTYIEEYPFLKRDWWPLFEKHGVTHVICQKSAMSYIDWRYPFERLRLIAEDSHYAAYAVPSRAQRSCDPPERVTRLLVVQNGPCGSFPATAQLMASCVRKYPGVRIAIACRAEAEGLYRRCPYAKEFFPLAPSGANAASTFTAVSAFAPEMAINCSWPGDAFSDGVCLAAEAPFSVAVQPTVPHDAYDLVLPTPRQTTPQAFVDTLLDRMGIGRLRLAPRTWAAPEDDKPLGDALNTHAIDASASVLLPIPAGCLPEACMIVAHGMAALARSGTAPHVTVIGQDAQCALMAKLLGRAGLPHTVLPGHADQGLWPALFSRFARAIVLDWGTSWLATASGLRHLAIPGSAHPANWMPPASRCIALSLPLECQECSGVCRYPVPHCLLAIPAEATALAIAALLDEERSVPMALLVDAGHYHPTDGMPAWSPLRSPADVPTKMVFGPDAA